MSDVEPDSPKVKNHSSTKLTSRTEIEKLEFVLSESDSDAEELIDSELDISLDNKISCKESIEKKNVITGHGLCQERNQRG
jgi:hypothetical protein